MEPWIGIKDQLADLSRPLCPCLIFTNNHFTLSDFWNEHFPSICKGCWTLFFLYISQIFLNTLPISCLGLCDAFFCCDGLSALDPRCVMIIIIDIKIIIVMFIITTASRLLEAYLRRLVPVMKPGATGMLAGYIKVIISNHNQSLKVGEYSIKHHQLKYSWSWPLINIKVVLRICT